MTDISAPQAKALAFVDAYITSGFNATEAARRTFRIGSKGGQNAQRTAESMGSEYLRKPEVRKILVERLQKEFADQAFVLENLFQLAKNARTERDRIRATELIGKFLAMFTEKHEVKSNALLEIIRDRERNAKRVDWDRLDRGPSHID